MYGLKGEKRGFCWGCKGVALIGVFLIDPVDSRLIWGICETQFTGYPLKLRFQIPCVFPVFSLTDRNFRDNLHDL